MSEELKVSEIFLSLQGESTHAGLPCTLVRLAGCNLRCSWCDTPYAQDPSSGREMSVDDICKQVADLSCPRVEVTGGEPLTQPSCLDLLTRLCDEGYITLLETNGSEDISVVDERVMRIVDFKCPSSGHENANRIENIEHLTGRDEVKFVIANSDDYEYARETTAKYNLNERCGAVLFSPVADGCGPAELAAWILRDHLDVRLGLQLHKIIWPDKDRGV